MAQAEPILDLDFSKDPCSYFTLGKVKAATLSITVLVPGCSTGKQVIGCLSALKLDRRCDLR